MIWTMDYDLPSEPLVGEFFDYNVGMGLKSEDLCNGEKGQADNLNPWCGSTLSLMYTWEEPQQIDC